MEGYCDALGNASNNDSKDAFVILKFKFDISGMISFLCVDPVYMLGPKVSQNCSLSGCEIHQCDAD